MTTCAIYARKSTQQFGDGEDRSVERQIANAREFAAAKGWLVLDEHVYCDDGISGAADLSRLRAKAKLRDAIRNGPPFGVLVTQSNDRLSRRDGAEALIELREIAKRGVAVWFYATGERFQYGGLRQQHACVQRDDDADVGHGFRLPQCRWVSAGRLASCAGHGARCRTDDP